MVDDEGLTSSVASSAAATAPPVHAIALSAQGTHLAVCTPTGVDLISVADDPPVHLATLSTDIDPPQAPPATPTRMAFVRSLAFSPDGKLLAMSGDDKSIRVFPVDQFSYGNEQLNVFLHKRSSQVTWQDDCSVLVADKFGDLRRYTVSQNGPVAAQTRPTKKPRLDAPGQTTAQTDVSDDSDDENDLHPPLVGHVSFMTSFLLAPGPSSHTVSYLLTADRDEHIRVSRWTKRQRAGHIIENFLLGSDAFVGALTLLPLQASAALVPGSNLPLLLSSDGGTALRLWNYLDPRPTQRLSVVDVRDALLPWTRVDPVHERLRERGVLDADGNERARPVRAPRKSGSKKDANGVNGDSLGTGSSSHGTSKELEEQLEYFKRCSALVISQLVAFEAGGQQWVLFRVEGAAAFFHMPLVDIRPMSTLAVEQPINASASVVATPTSCPVLALALHQSTDGSDHKVRLWAACDQRDTVCRDRSEGPFSNQRLRRYEFDIASNQFTRVEAAEPTSLPADAALSSTIPRATVTSLALYGPLTTWPKYTSEEAQLTLAKAALARATDGTTAREVALPAAGAPERRYLKPRFETGGKAQGRADVQKRLKEGLGALT